MKKFSIVLLFICPFLAFGQTINKPADLVEWINPLMGTASSPDLSNSNTYPSIALPWAMNAWTLINAPNNSDDNKYVQQIKLNGAVHLNNWISHAAITTGGSFNYTMGSVPNMQRGTDKKSFPFSLSTSK